MKIEVNERGRLIFKEIYEPILLKTQEGNTVSLAMRDDTIELTVAGSDRWYRADMDTGEIVEI